jgi:hypothetical protein
MMKRFSLITTLMIAAVISFPAVAGAKGGSVVKCKAYSIVAKEKKQPLPKELKQFKKIFGKMPFKVFGSFKLLKQSKLQLSSKVGKAALSKKLNLKIKLLDRIISSKNKKRYRISLQIMKKVKGTKKKTVSIYNMVMKLTSNKPMFIAGPKEGGGTLVIGLVCQ